MGNTAHGTTWSKCKKLKSNLPKTLINKRRYVNALCPWCTDNYSHLESNKASGCEQGPLRVNRIKGPCKSCCQSSGRMRGVTERQGLRRLSRGEQRYPSQHHKCPIQADVVVPQPGLRLKYNCWSAELVEYAFFVCFCTEKPKLVSHFISV